MGTLYGKVATSMSFSFADPYDTGAISWTAGRRIWIAAYALSNFHTNGLGSDWAISDNASTNSITWTQVAISSVDTTLDSSLRNQMVIWSSSELTATETFTVSVDPQSGGSDQFYFNLVGMEYDGGDGTATRTAFNTVTGSGSVTYGSAPSGTQAVVAFATGASGGAVSWPGSAPSGWSFLSNGTSGSDGLQVNSITSTTNTSTTVAFSGDPHDLQATLAIEFADSSGSNNYTVTDTDNGILVGDTSSLVAAYTVTPSDGILVGDTPEITSAYAAATGDNGMLVGDTSSLVAAYTVTATDNGILVGDTEDTSFAGGNNLTFSDGILVGDTPEMSWSAYYAFSDGSLIGDSSIVSFGGISSTIDHPFRPGQEALLVDGYDISGDVGGIDNISTPINVQEVTGIDKYAKERIGLLPDPAFDFTGYFNPTGLHALASQLPTSDVHVSYLTGRFIGMPAAHVVGKQVNYDIEMGDDKAMTVKVKVAGSSRGLIWGDLLTSGIEPYTTSTVTSSIDRGSSAIPGRVFWGHVTALTGASVTVSLEHSADDSTFVDVDASCVLTFTDEGYQGVEIPTGLLRYIRVAISGSFSAVTLAACYS